MAAFTYILFTTMFGIGLFIIILVTQNLGRLQIKKSVHRTIFAVYIVLLLIALVVGEAAEKKLGNQMPERLPYDNQFDLEYAIINKQPIPESLLLEKRTHEVGETLDITNAYNQAVVLIERTKDAGHTVKEAVYTPELGASFGNDAEEYYDFSGMLDVELPVWTNHSMTVPIQPRNDISFKFFHDSNVLGQFTGEKTTSYSSSSYSRFMSIHLIVPESVELKLPEAEGDEYTHYVRVIE